MNLPAWYNWLSGQTLRRNNGGVQVLGALGRGRISLSRRQSGRRPVTDYDLFGGALALGHLLCLVLWLSALVLSFCLPAVLSRSLACLTKYQAFTPTLPVHGTSRARNCS